MKEHVISVYESSALISREENGLVVLVVVPRLPVCVSSPISQALWLGRRGIELSGDSQWPRPPRSI